jgi:FMN reductase
LAKTAVGIAGSLFAPSRSGVLVDAVLAQLAQRGFETRLVDISTLPADALFMRAKSAELDDALAAVAAADAIVIGTPTYRATYSGQLKSFFDLLPVDALKGSVAGLIGSGAVALHALSVDHGLRPLVASLRGLSASSSIFATDAEFPEGAKGGVPESLRPRVEALAEELVTLCSR